MSKLQSCNVRRYNDQMSCACGLSWDVNDLDVPCRVGVEDATPPSEQALVRIREALKVIDPAGGLLSMPETPLNWLPAFGIQAGMYRVSWSSFSHFKFVVVSRHGKPIGQARNYLFFNHIGMPVTEVLVEDGIQGRNAARRDFIECSPTEWTTA